MKKQLLVLIIFMLSGFWAIGQGNENFTNYTETSNAYHDGSFTGMDGSTWTYTQCRGDSSIVAPSPTMGKARPATAKIISGKIHNGCGTISFSYKQPFATSVNLNLYINGLVVKNVTSTGQGTVYNSGPVVVNTSGDFTIMLKQADSLSSGQVTVDNIIWTAFGGGPTPEPTNYPTNFTASTAPFTINLAWTDAIGTQQPSAYLVFASDQNNITAPVDGTPVSNDPALADGHGVLNILQGVKAAVFSNLPPNKQYYFKIFPYTNAGSLINYKTDGTPPDATITTTKDVIIDSLRFTNLTFGNWIVKDVIGAQSWLVDPIHGIGGSPCGKMSGFAGSSNVNEDWLISPAMDFTKYNNELLTFQSAYNYVGAPLQALISNNYDGSGNPNNFTWTALNPTWSPGGWAWTSSGNINVSGTIGTQVYIGFKFTSTASESSTWELDDIVITGDLIIGIDDKNTDNGSFSVSPNPASGKCSLRFGNDETKVISVISMVGNTVMETTTNQANYSLNLTTLAKGIYFVKIYLPASKSSQVRKLVVQ
jgi:hypothetical protein